MSFEAAAPAKDDLLSPADAAQVLGLSADMVRLLARDGRLPTAARSVRGVRLFRRADVQDLAAIRAGKPVLSHAVQFYESAEFLCSAVARFLGEGLRAGAPVISIATAAHRRALCEQLEAGGTDVRSASASGQLTLLDADETLAGFMADGMPVAKRFRAHAGGIIARAGAARPHRRLRVYGEMVDVLLREGKARAAFKLEKLWNELGRSHSISLLCSCGMTNFRGRRAVAQFDQISRSHLRVVPTEKFPDHHTGHPWLRGIARLQQRVSALESEIERRKDHERSLRKLLRAKGEFVIGLPRGGSSR
jgi:hypothetical protein